MPIFPRFLLRTARLPQSKVFEVRESQMVVSSQKHRAFFFPLTVVIVLAYCSSYYFRNIGLALIATGLLLIVPTIQLPRMHSFGL
jgi:hypothetical protein